MIKLIIFDLDNTLFDTYGQLGIKVLDKMIKRMRKAGLTVKQEKVLREKYIFTGFRVLASELKLSGKVKDIGMSVYEEMDLSGIKPFDDIDVIGSLEQKKALVTSGTEEVQMNKIRILGIGHLFDDVVVDEANNVDGRKRIFSELAKHYRLKPGQILVIGDNPEIELAAGKSLGMITAQIRRREHVLDGKADYHVKGLHALKEILDNYRQ
jgi:putative hydrolase of the HAD superfamily